MLGGFFYTIITELVLAAALVTLLLANLGSITTHKGITSIYLLELNLSELSIDTVFPSLSDIDSISDLGLDDAYVLGMYGYCQGTGGTTNSTTSDEVVYDTNFTASSCTHAKPMYVFDPVTFLLDQVNDVAGTELTTSDVNLPSSIENYVKIAQNLSKATYITSCIAIGLNFIVLVLTLFIYCCNLGLVSSLGLVEVVAFLAAIIASGCSTGMYVFIETHFNDKLSKYGIHAALSKNYLILTWVGTVLSAAAAVLLLANSCFRCCCGGRRRDNFEEEEQFMPIEKL
ncbi:hypothetical protein FOA43_002996 [Brettanomyces nanus]|uniref:Uncharacterized protein n=1 Tax=Eeniella nana TaxID=13502 RepID=A0A875S7F5_EENNA|nr:uncharacterized protein FOA43_002996 [Brettanomyces nanus]QPG75639.1 hypothetical protein FOA43_002996 [Brettanomyces nanus]